VATDPSVPLELGPEERVLNRWAVELVGSEGRSSQSGWLVLTTHRCLFVRKTGFFGRGKRDPTPRFSTALDSIQTLTERSSSMSIGYGDRVSVPGIEVNGQEFRLGRETNPPSVVAAIASARRARRTEGPARIL
jgi:hypothetical protein